MLDQLLLDKLKNIQCNFACHLVVFKMWTMDISFSPASLLRKMFSPTSLTTKLNKALSIGVTFRLPYKPGNAHPTQYFPCYKLYFFFICLLILVDFHYIGPHGLRCMGLSEY